MQPRAGLVLRLLLFVLRRRGLGGRSRMGGGMCCRCCRCCMSRRGRRTRCGMRGRCGRRSGRGWRTRSGVLLWRSGVLLWLWMGWRGMLGRMCRWAFRRGFTTRCGMRARLSCGVFCRGFTTRCGMRARLSRRVFRRGFTTRCSMLGRLSWRGCMFGGMFSDGTARRYDARSLELRRPGGGGDCGMPAILFRGEYRVLGGGRDVAGLSRGYRDVMVSFGQTVSGGRLGCQPVRAAGEADMRVVDDRDVASIDIGDLDAAEIVDGAVIGESTAFPPAALVAAA